MKEPLLDFLTLPAHPEPEEPRLPAIFRAAAPDGSEVEGSWAGAGPAGPGRLPTPGRGNSIKAWTLP